MSIAGDPALTLQVGDHVLLYRGFGRMNSIVLAEDDKINTACGVLPHSYLAGLAYGQPLVVQPASSAPQPAPATPAAAVSAVGPAEEADKTQVSRHLAATGEVQSIETEESVPGSADAAQGADAEEDGDEDMADASASSSAVEAPAASTEAASDAEDNGTSESTTTRNKRKAPEPPAPATSSSAPKPAGKKSKRKGRGRDNAQSMLLIPLRPLPDLWTEALVHRTQILYHADIAMILSQLELAPGCVVLESGTGSGSLTTAMARVVAQHGHVHTFEFNRDRVQKARVDFERNGISHVVSVYHRDIVGLGFPRVQGGADAVFLDLPSPWVVVPSARAALKSHGKLCSFSPCMEQVQRTCLALEQHGFADIRTYECLTREYDVRTDRMSLPRMRARIVCPQTSRPAHIVLDEEEEEEEEEEDTGDADAHGATQTTNTAGGETGGENNGSSNNSNNNNKKKKKRRKLLTEERVMTRPKQEIKGHTGYLTFASVN